MRGSSSSSVVAVSPQIDRILVPLQSSLYMKIVPCELAPRSQFSFASFLDAESAGDRGNSLGVIMPVSRSL